MRMGADRIRQIVLSLRNFSRTDEAQMKPVDIHEGIDSTLLILQHRLKKRSPCPDIEVIKEYGNLPQIECYAAQLNQVFMNIISNAIDALEEAIDKGQWAEAMDDGQWVMNEAMGSNGRWAMGNEQSLLPIAYCPLPTIYIRTEVLESNRISICIGDNGPGILEHVRSQIFNPFLRRSQLGREQVWDYPSAIRLLLIVIMGSSNASPNLAKGQNSN